MHCYNVANERFFSTLHTMLHKNKINHELLFEKKYLKGTHWFIFIKNKIRVQNKICVYFKIKYFRSKLYSSILINKSVILSSDIQ